MDDTELEKAHRHCSRHRDEIMRSTICGCFYCLDTYPPADITDWCDPDPDGRGTTALCPRCHVDSVIGSASGFPITKDFLKAMYERWFGRTTPISVLRKR